MTVDVVGMTSPDALREAYDRNLRQFEALRDEVEHIIRIALAESEIKIDAIELRVKEFSSVIQKAQTKKVADPLEEFDDIVGARIICLFRSDVDKIGQHLRYHLDVLKVDDKVASSGDSFGYLSVHYTCRIPTRYVGPRYLGLHEMVFEVQVRTLCMHAWAAVSHYLEYKSEGDIPSELRKSLAALSGLFYVADDQFEASYKARHDYTNSLKGEVGDKVSSKEVNLDTVKALILKYFPNRSNAEIHLGELVSEMKSYGFSDLSIVEDKLNSVLNNFIDDEKKRYKRVYFSGVGALRVALGMADAGWDVFTNPPDEDEDVE